MGEIGPLDEVERVDDVGTREFVEEKRLVILLVVELVVEVLLIVSDPKLVIIETGPEPKVSSRELL